jgi:chromosome segregation protein
VVTVDLVPGWFEEAQRAFAALRTRIEHAERELADRKAALEAQDRALTEREAQFDETQRSADVEARNVAERAKALDQELRRLAEKRAAIARDSQSLALGLRELDAAREEVRERQEALHRLSAELAEREAAAEQSRKDLEVLQSGHEVAYAAAREEVAYAAAREEIANANEALLRQARSQGADVPADPAAAATLEDALHRVLSLREVMETAAASAAARESRAQDLLASATQRAEEIDSVERKVKEEEGRLAGVKAEIVNAKKALLVVDAALLRMPYEVVDDFTRSDAFENYERAIKAIRRFAD